jgi:hypothetical protein
MIRPRLLAALCLLCASAIAPCAVAEFIGWRGGDAVFRSEELLPGSKIRTSFFCLGAASRPVPLSAKYSGLPRGTALVKDYATVTAYPSVSFQFQARPEELDALYAAVRARALEGSGAKIAFPIVNASLTIRLGPNPDRIVWRRNRALSAVAGDNGFHFDPPRLRTAILSPTGAVMLIELYGSDGSEFIRIPLAPAIAPRPRQ